MGGIMKKIVILTFSLAFGLFMLFLSFEKLENAYAGDGCYMCGSGSSDGITHCKYHGSDTFDQRKKCQAKGCKITGTSSCPTAANYKVIDPN
jgi:hypothetical protein